MAKRKIPNNLRKLCYERDNYRCQSSSGCEASLLNGDTLNLHHILPEQFGGQETPDNLITLCDIHHKQMHIEFSAFYPDSKGVLYKMNRFIKKVHSNIRSIFGIDDGYNLLPYLSFLTNSSQFNSGQIKTIRTALSGEDILFVSPTGSGKSVCYQLPGLIGTYPSLVISPLKSLMKDQVESIWSKKIPATYINSDIGSTEKEKRYAFIKENLYKFIFVAPERFFSKDPKTIDLYQKYSHLVIDEAHEIEMWGMAFRPAYKHIGALHKKLNKPPIIALTATASKYTQTKILESLNIPNAKVIVTGFYRDNIDIQRHQSGVLDEKGYPSISKYEYIKDIIKTYPKDKILIFTPTLKTGNDLLNYLKSSKIETDFYHSQLKGQDKMTIQDRYTGKSKPELNVLISTSAFGMGIDIPNIRHIIHFSPALSITDYVQQIGRAGRDGKQSFAHLLYHENDDKLLNFMVTLPLKSPGFKEKHGYNDADVLKVDHKLKEQLADMLKFTKEPTKESWKYILDHFGEKPPSFWDRYGKLFIDTMLIFIIILLFILMI
jgi:ATP-dependent DNA helicase RecQ